MTIYEKEYDSKQQIRYMDNLLTNIVYQKRFKSFIFRIVEDKETKEIIISIHHIKSGALVTNNKKRIFNMLSKLTDKNEVFEIEKEILQYV